MLDWLKNINKEYPEFWKEYLSKFETKKKSNRFVILSTETSGPNLDKDVILSVSAISIVNEAIIINDSFDVVLLQHKDLQDNELPPEFIAESKQTKWAEPQEIQEFVEYLGKSV